MKESLKKISSDILFKLSIILLIMIYGCCAPSTDLSKYENAEILAKERFCAGYEVAKNESDTFILFYKKDEKKNQPHTFLNYFIYNVNKNEIVYEEKIYDAEIKWLDDQNIEIRINPEIISSDEDVTVFILNVLTKEKQKTNFIN